MLNLLCATSASQAPASGKAGAWYWAMYAKYASLLQLHHGAVAVAVRPDWLDRWQAQDLPLRASMTAAPLPNPGQALAGMRVRIPHGVTTQLQASRQKQQGPSRPELAPASTDAQMLLASSMYEPPTHISSPLAGTAAARQMSIQIRRSSAAGTPPAKRSRRESSTPTSAADTRATERKQHAYARAQRDLDPRT